MARQRDRHPADARPEFEDAAGRQRAEIALGAIQQHVNHFRADRKKFFAMIVDLVFAEAAFGVHPEIWILLAPLFPLHITHNNPSISKLFVSCLSAAMRMRMDWYRLMLQVLPRLGHDYL